LNNQLSCKLATPASLHWGHDYKNLDAPSSEILQLEALQT